MTTDAQRKIRALQEELDWMTAGVGGTDMLHIYAAVLLRWRNTLADVLRKEQTLA